MCKGAYERPSCTTAHYEPHQTTPQQHPNLNVDQATLVYLARGPLVTPINLHPLPYVPRRRGRGRARTNLHFAWRMQGARPCSRRWSASQTPLRLPSTPPPTARDQLPKTAASSTAPSAHPAPGPHCAARSHRTPSLHGLKHPERAGTKCSTPRACCRPKFQRGVPCPPSYMLTATSVRLTLTTVNAHFRRS
jgi:hypothetical protein